MRLFNKTIDRQLFKQYSLGSDLSKQEVVVKIFNPQGAGSWFILNSDPQDPDYLWAIVDLGYGAEVGSVSRNDLESYRGRFGLGFERDLSFDPINAEELYKGLRQGKYYADGGLITEDKLKEEEWFSPDMKIMYQYRNGRLGITLFYGKDRRYSKKTVINNASELSIKELNSEVKKEVAELKQFAKEILENNFADGGDVQDRSMKVGDKVYRYYINYDPYKEVVSKSKTYTIVSIEERRPTFENGYSRFIIKTDDGIIHSENTVIKVDYVESNNYVKGNYFESNNYAKGGELVDYSDNQLMIMNQNVELEHHHEELEDILEDKIPVPAWVVAKMATATQSVSDVTHYLDGEKELMEDENENENEGEDEEEGEDEDEIKSKEVVEPINVSAETKAELTKNFTDDALVNLKGFLKGMEGIELRDDYTFDYKNEQFEIEPIINSDQNGVSNAVFTIFDGDGEEQGEVTYSREGGKQKFTANSEFFSWDRAKFEDGGFMNNVYADGGYFDGTIPKVSTYMSNYADGGQIRVGDRYKFNWTDTEGNKGYTIREVVKQNVTSGKDFRTKVMIMKVVESSMPETVGRMEEEYKPSFKKAIERGMEISMQEGKPRMADDDYATGGVLDAKTVKIGDWLQKKDNKAKAKVFDIKKDKYSTEIFVEDLYENKVSRPISLEDWKKIAEPTRELERIKKVFEEMNYAKGGGIENDGYNLKDINGKKINVGDTVRTTQPSGGLMNPANPEIGIVEKTKDAFGNDALQIKYRKQGTNYDRFILLNGKINEIVDKSSSSFEQGGFMNNVYAKGGGLSEIETSKSGKLKTNGEIEESWYNTFGEGIVNKKGEEVGVKINDINKGIVYYQALAKDTPENREGYGWEEHNDEVGFIYKKFATIDDLERFVNKTEDKPKYILKADIKTVTVKRNGKDVTYKGADVLNGANLLAEGGDLTSKANYVAKRDVVSVELKDGTTIKPVNGYWIKKGAEPIGTEPTPNTSGKSEPKVGETYIRKDARGNWRAETNVENFNGYDWRISTVKTYSGNLVSSAQGGKTEATGTKGIVIFKYTMYQDPNHTLEVSKPSRLTDKVVSEQHTKGLAKFKKFIETGMFKGGGKISNFDKLSAKVAKEYEGKPVKNQYQEEYGKYYSREEAQEVGDKVAGKVKAMQTDSKAFGGLFKNVKNLAKPKPKYPNLEGKQVPLKSGDFVMVFTQDENTLSVINVGKIGSGIKPRNIDISEVDMTNFKAGGQTGTKKMNSGTETLKRANDLAKKIRMDGESWLDAKKRAFAELRKENKA